MSSRSRVRDTLEYALARSVLVAAGLLPDACLGPVSRGLGRLLARLLRGRRRVVAENVRLAFGDGPDAPDAEHLARASFANLVRNFLELGRLPADRERMRGLFRYRTPRDRELAEMYALRGPVVVAASHFGAYEVGGLAGPLLGLRLTSLARPLDNALLESYLSGIRMRFGQGLASNRGGLLELQQALRAGGAVAVLVDLNHRPRSRIFVDFFGVPAATATTAAVLAVKAGCPLLPMFMHRARGAMRFQIEIGEPRFPRPGADRRGELQRLMQEVTRDVEDRIRAEPEQWLWTHRRWKTRPEGHET